MSNIYKEIFEYLQQINYKDTCDAKRRYEFAKKYSWAIPNPKSISKIAEFIDDDVLSIGAGTGLWEYLISKQIKNKITAIDIIDERYSEERKYYKIIKARHDDDIGKKLLKEHYGKILMLVWPPFNTSMAYDCVIFSKPRKIIYIGEGLGGATANNDFFKYIDKYYDKTIILIPQFCGIDDNCYLYYRKKYVDIL